MTASADGSHEQPFIADKLPAPLNQVPHRNTCKSVGPAWTGWAYHTAARAAAPGSYLFGKMENQELSLPGVWQGDVGLPRQPVGSLQPSHLCIHPAVLWGEAARAGKLFISPLNTLTCSQKWPRQRWHGWGTSLSCGPGAASGIAPACPSGHVLVTLPYCQARKQVPSLLPTPGPAVGDAQARSPSKGSSVDGSRTIRPQKSKQMLSPVDKKQPQAPAGSWHQGLGLILASGINW